MNKPSLSNFKTIDPSSVHDPGWKRVYVVYLIGCLAHKKPSRPIMVCEDLKKARRVAEEWLIAFPQYTRTPEQVDHPEFQVRITEIKLF